MKAQNAKMKDMKRHQTQMEGNDDLILVLNRFLKNALFSRVGRKSRPVAFLGKKNG